MIYQVVGFVSVTKASKIGWLQNLYLFHVSKLVAITYFKLYFEKSFGRETHFVFLQATQFLIVQG